MNIENIPVKITAKNLFEEKVLEDRKDEVWKIPKSLEDIFYDSDDLDDYLKKLEFIQEGELKINVKSPKHLRRYCELVSKISTTKDLREYAKNIAKNTEVEHLRNIEALILKIFTLFQNFPFFSNF